LRLQGLQALRLGSFVALEDGSKDGTGCKSITDLDGVTVPCRIQLTKKFYTAKRKREGITFVCKDFIKLLKEYLVQRQKLGETINANTPIFPTYRVKLRVIANGVTILRHRDSWASVGAIITASAAMGGGGTSAGPTPNHGQTECEVLEITCNPLADDSIEAVFRRVRERTEIQFDPTSERAVSPHSLRKYLHSTLDAAGVNIVMVNVIIGHSNAIADHYSGRKNLDIEEIRHAYESAMHRIAVTDESNGTRVLQLEKEQKQDRATFEQKIATIVQLQLDMVNVLNKLATKGADPITADEIAKFRLQLGDLTKPS